MTRMGNLSCYPWQSGSSEVIVHVQNIGEQRLGGGLLDVQLLHLLCHHDGFPRDFLPWSPHLEDPRQPLQEYDGHLQQDQLKDQVDKLFKRQNFV